MKRTGFFFYCCRSFCPSFFRSDSFSAVCLLSFVKLHFVFSCLSLLCDSLINFARILSGMSSEFFSSIVWVNLPNRQIQFLSLIGCSCVHFCLKLFPCVSKDTSGWCQVANHNLWSSSCSNSNSFSTEVKISFLEKQNS